MRISNEIKALFERDLDRLRAELDAYSDDDRLWQVAKDIKNSAGNLIMHICGNLQHYIGAVLSETGYVRDRDFEFTGRVAREELEPASTRRNASFANISRPPPKKVGPRITPQIR